MPILKTKLDEFRELMDKPGAGGVPQYGYRFLEEIALDGQKLIIPNLKKLERASLDLLGESGLVTDDENLVYQITDKGMEFYNNLKELGYNRS